MTITPMTAVHIPALAAIEAACFSTPWSATALAEELDNPLAVFLVAVDGDRVLGYVGCHVLVDEGYIDNVAVSPAARRHGIGRALLAALEQTAHQKQLYRLTLEVRVSNTAAIALYEGAGYIRDAVRPGLYRLPTEDGAIYSLYL